MSSRKGDMICVWFEDPPADTHYQDDTYSWLSKQEANEAIEAGYGKEFDPAQREVVAVESEPAQPTSDIPEDFPARHHFIEAEVYSYDAVKQMAEDGDLQNVPGIGDSTEHKILTYLGD